MEPAPENDFEFTMIPAGRMPADRQGSNIRGRTGRKRTRPEHQVSRIERGLLKSRRNARPLKPADMDHGTELHALRFLGDHTDPGQGGGRPAPKIIIPFPTPIRGHIGFELARGVLERLEWVFLSASDGRQQKGEDYGARSLEHPRTIARGTPEVNEPPSRIVQANGA